MKSLIQYTYSCSNAFHTFLKNEDLDALIKDLKRIENDAKKTIGGKGNGLWFRFFKGDTAATTIADIENDLSLPIKHNGNRLHLIDSFKICTSDTNPDNELRVFYS